MVTKSDENPMHVLTFGYSESVAMFAMLPRAQSYVTIIVLGANTVHTVDREIQHLIGAEWQRVTNDLDTPLWHYVNGTRDFYVLQSFDERDMRENPTSYTSRLAPARHLLDRINTLYIGSQLCIDPFWFTDRHCNPGQIRKAYLTQCTMDYVGPERDHIHIKTIPHILPCVCKSGELMWVVNIEGIRKSSLPDCFRLYDEEGVSAVPFGGRHTCVFE
jgi:hypothetical protein